MNATILKKNVGVLGAVLMNQDNEIGNCGYGRNDMDEIIQFNNVQPGTHVVEAVHDGAFLIKKEHFEEFGGFDEHYKMVNHNTDLCLRMKKEGLLSYVCDAAKGLHYGSLSHLYKPVSILMWDRNVFMKKHMINKGAKIYGETG
jgi:GT2 family glycosyltransferase